MDFPYLSVSQVAEQLGKAPKTIYRYIRERGLPSYKVGNTHLIRPDDLRRWIESHPVRPSPHQARPRSHRRTR